MSHDGIHNLPSFFLQNDVIFDDGSFDGPIYYWQDPAAFERFNPGRAELLRNWLVVYVGNVSRRASAARPPPRSSRRRLRARDSCRGPRAGRS